MARTRYFFRKVGDAFPSSNRLAKVVWSLLAIRSDLDFEVSFIGHNDERARAVFRHDFLSRMYFLRGTLRSLYSAHRQLHRLSTPGAGEEFRQLAEQLGRWQEFVDLRRLVGRSSRQFDDYRNAFGAHAEWHLEESLANTSAEHEVVIGVTDEGRLGLTYGAEAFLAAFSQAVGSRELAAMEEAIRSLRDVTVSCMSCIDLAIFIYSSRYPVISK